MGLVDPKLVKADVLVAEVARKQHGVITATQLKEAGLTPTQVRWRVRSGLLHRVHRAVYAVGHQGLSNEGRWMAAVLACGPGAALSHRPAAEHHRLLAPTAKIIDVTVPGRGGRAKRSGLRIHRSSLPSDATMIRDGIRVTTPARTLADLKRVVEAYIYRRAVRQAEYLKLPLGGLVTDGTRSDLEADFLRLCRRYHLPLPEVNVRVGPFTVDFLWPDCRLVVETDSYATHGGRQAFEDDRARDAELRRLGYEVHRLTDRQMSEQPALVADAISRTVKLISCPPPRARSGSPSSS